MENEQVKELMKLIKIFFIDFIYLLNLSFTHLD